MKLQDLTLETFNQHKNSYYELVKSANHDFSYRIEGTAKKKYYIDGFVPLCGSIDFIHINKPYFYVKPNGEKLTLPKYQFTLNLPKDETLPAFNKYRNSTLMALESSKIRDLFLKSMPYSVTDLMPNTIGVTCQDGADPSVLTKFGELYRHYYRLSIGIDPSILKKPIYYNKSKLLAYEEVEKNFKKGDIVLACAYFYLYPKAKNKLVYIFRLANLKKLGIYDNNFLHKEM